MNYYFDTAKEEQERWGDAAFEVGEKLGSLYEEVKRFFCKNVTGEYEPPEAVVERELERKMDELEELGIKDEVGPLGLGPQEEMWTEEKFFLKKGPKIENRMDVEAREDSFLSIRDYNPDKPHSKEVREYEEENRSKLKWIRKGMRRGLEQGRGVPVIVPVREEEQ